MQPQPTAALAPVGLIDGRGTTRRQVAALENRVLAILDEHSPASVRQMFYRCLERDGGA